MERLYLRKSRLTYTKTLAIFKYLEALHLQIYLTKKGQNLITRRRGTEFSLATVLTLTNTLTYGRLKLNKSLS